MYILMAKMYIMTGKRKSRRWTMAEARKRLPDVVRAAEREPQVLYRREKIVGAIIGPQELQKLRPDVAAPKGTIEDKFAELRKILDEEGIDSAFPEGFPERSTRPNPFVDDDDVSR
jgi:hypothetical protein